MPLSYKVYVTRRPGVNRDVPAGLEELKWVPTSSTLIYGDRDAVLVDTPLTKDLTREVLDWVLASGKSLKYIYITHPHGDHYFGVGTIMKSFPGARAIATKEVVMEMAKEINNERSVNLSMWNQLFPGQIPDDIVGAEALDGDEFELEGEKLYVVRTGHTDTDKTSTLWVPSIGLAVTGDSTYNNTHPYLMESKTADSRHEWVKALRIIAALKPSHVVSGHKDPSQDDSPNVIEWTTEYFANLERLNLETKTAEKLYRSMLELYPNCLNPGSLWGAANVMKS